MPVSTSIHLSHCLRWIVQLNPASVLDVGCGFGQWGFLSREYLDVFQGRVQPNEWNVRIDGIEVFEPYIQAHQRALYTSIDIADIREAVSNVDTHELIIAGDVIEHLDKDEGEDVVAQLYEKATRALLVAIPIGEGWDHPEQHGNPGELHRSMWHVEDFEPYPSVQEMFQLPCGSYGAFLCMKDCSPESRMMGLLSTAERYLEQGSLPAALRHLRRAHALDPAHHTAAIALTDPLLQSEAPDAACTVLEDTLTADAEFIVGRLMLAKLLAAFNRAGEARTHIEALSQRTGLPQNIRAEIDALQGKLAQ